MSGFEFDVSEVDALATRLGGAGPRVLSGVRAVVEESAQAVEAQMRADFSGSRRARHFPRSIDHDVRVTFGGAVEAEIGPNKRKKQGALGNILAFGTSRNGPIADIMNSLRSQEPAMVKAMQELGAKALDD